MLLRLGREPDRQKDRQTDRQTERETRRDRHGETDTEEGEYRI